MLPLFRSSPRLGRVLLILLVLLPTLAVADSEGRRFKFIYESRIGPVASGLGDSGEKASIVEKDLQEGIAKGVTGTPTFFVGSEKIGGAVPFATLDAAVARQIG